MLFQSGNPNNLFRVDAGGGFPPVRIVESGNSLISRDWSLDGQTMMYDELSPGTNRDIWVLSVTPDGKPKTGARPQPYLRTPFNEMGGQFSPEPSPSWVAYESDESGTYEVYVQAYPEPKGKFLISSGGGRGPRWGPGGRELYVSGGKLTAVKLKMDAESVTASSPVALFGVAWGNVYSSPFAVSPDGQRFLVQIPVETAARPLEVIVNWPALLKKAGSTE